jgi:peptide/nickel transport system substrate-binding protein
VARLHDVLRHDGDRRRLDRPKEVRREGRRRRLQAGAVGAGPYKFVSFTPGVELVLEANEQYWRKSPSVKRLVFKSIPDESTRLAMLKRGEADIAYSIRGALAEELKRTPGLTLKPNYPPGTFWLVFPEQWTDPKSPWADKRVRLRASYAIDRPAINRAETLGFSRITGSMIPHNFEFYWPRRRRSTIRRRPNSS